jgi:hypothetical protein
MFVICAQCHKVTAEAEPLLNFDARYTLCNACYHLAKLEYYKMLNDFYLERVMNFEP